MLAGSDVSAIDVLIGRSAWKSEGRWERRPLADYLPPITTDIRPESGRGCLRLTSESGWSSSRWVPTGVLEDRETGLSAAWQIEINGPWNLELTRRKDGVGLAAYGPTDLLHGWMRILRPGEEFRTVPAVITIGTEGWEDAVEELTRYRRALRVRSGVTTPTVPVIYNDYLNTIMADPTSATELPLIAAAAEVGAKVYCIDAGWFASKSEDWTLTMGAWQPSPDRFEGGLGAVLHEISRRGMTPGLWIEPLAVGTDSPVVDDLADHFMTRCDVPLVEEGRLRLDMRSPGAHDYLHGVLDRMIGWGVGYLKIDDNSTVGIGPDRNAASAGDAMLEHSRGWAAWVAEASRRHPEMIVENCASGGMTSDYAMLAHVHTQSTSDQQDLTRYPTIAAAAPMAVLPEQAANWAVPQPNMSPGKVIMTLVNSLAGTLFLSGHLDQLDDESTGLVRQAVALATQERSQLAWRRPHWPLGLPRWDDEWVALALLPTRDVTVDDGLLFVWHRASAPEGPSSVMIPTIHPHARWTLGYQLFPTPETEDAPWRVCDGDDAITITLTGSDVSARVYRIVRVKADSPVIQAESGDTDV